MKQIYRCEYLYLLPKKQSGGTVFLRALSVEQAIEDAMNVMRDILNKNGFSQVEFEVKAYLCFA